MKQIKKEIENFEEVLCPTLWSRVLIKGLIIGTLFILFAVGIKVSYDTFLNPPAEPAVIDQAWFIKAQQDVQGLDLEIVAAQDTLKRHQEEVESRSGLFSVSRKEDRVEERRLNNNILSLQKRRIDLIKNYNLRAATVEDQSVLNGLPIALGVENESSGL